MKRKRASQQLPSHKRVRAASETPNLALLRLFYTKVVTLRQYLVSKLPHSSKKRRRYLEQYGVLRKDQEEVHRRGSTLGTFLDTSLVGIPTDVVCSPQPSQDSELQVFSQQLSGPTLRANLSQGILSQTEVGSDAIRHGLHIV